MGRCYWDSRQTWFLRDREICDGHGVVVFLIWRPDYSSGRERLDSKHSWLHLVTIYSMVTV